MFIVYYHYCRAVPSCWHMNQSIFHQVKIILKPLSYLFSSAFILTLLASREEDFAFFHVSLGSASNVKGLADRRGLRWRLVPLENTFSLNYSNRYRNRVDFMWWTTSIFQLLTQNTKVSTLWALRLKASWISPFRVKSKEICTDKSRRYRLHGARLKSEINFLCRCSLALTNYFGVKNGHTIFISVESDSFVFFKYMKWYLMGDIQDRIAVVNVGKNQLFSREKGWVRDGQKHVYFSGPGDYGCLSSEPCAYVYINLFSFCSRNSSVLLIFSCVSTGNRFYFSPRYIIHLY